ncbi:MAG TPA: cob(I)yrinic acid a,c-diamide adenosyltransferase [Fimbriimonadaceae bacterium]|nr:cob(I)yrinic acid a,c-diamide adenosyltransferase [Fimbriimonadaceae bacterium]
MKIYTRTGDDGSTGIMGSRRLQKFSERIQSIGELDELNAAIGVARASTSSPELSGWLERIQNWIFEAGSELAAPGDPRFESINNSQVESLETSIDEWTRQLPEIKNFILPGGSVSASAVHLARAICRRAERTVVKLSNVETVRPEIIVFLNRLADWLFSAARFANYESNIEETIWKKGN